MFHTQSFKKDIKSKHGNEEAVKMVSIPLESLINISILKAKKYYLLIKVELRNRLRLLILPLVKHS